MALRRIETEITKGFHGVWKRIGAKGDAWQPYLALFKRYAEPHRYSHRLPYTMAMLKEFERIKHLCKKPNECEVALWYSHAVYILGARNNSERSALVARDALEQAQIKPEFISEVERFILLFRSHQAAREDIDGNFVIDMDLCVFGQPPAIYDEYESDLQKEYTRKETNAGAVSERMFIHQRIGDLESLIARKRIYRTRYFFRTYEESARLNISRQLEAMRRR